MYLIDGNNVMGQHPGWHRDRRGAQRRLLTQLAHLTQTKRKLISVVFDGMPDPHFPDGSRYCGVAIYYAREGSNADQRIIEMVEREPNRRSLTVVTSDRALLNQVRVCGARTMRSGAFRQMLDQLDAMAHDHAMDTKMSSIESDQMTEWLRYFGITEEDEATENDQ